MATKVKAEVNYTSTLGKAGKFTIGYINPDATNAKIKTLAQQLNALSTNTFSSVTKITETDITNAE